MDATTESQTGPKLGRLANHGMRGEINAKMLIKTFDSKPILCLYATKDIEKDSEVLYDYGIKNLPWVKQASKKIFFNKVYISVSCINLFTVT